MSQFWFWVQCWNPHVATTPGYKVTCQKWFHKIRQQTVVLRPDMGTKPGLIRDDIKSSGKYTFYFVPNEQMSDIVCDLTLFQISVYTTRQNRSLQQLAEIARANSPRESLLWSTSFPTELTPRVIPCCIVRILEECTVNRWTQPIYFPVGLFAVIVK